jgi:membrane protease YdiL (CAAX protease family)
MEPGTGELVAGFYSSCVLLAGCALLFLRGRAWKQRRGDLWPRSGALPDGHSWIIGCSLLAVLIGAFIGVLFWQSVITPMVRARFEGPPDAVVENWLLIGGGLMFQGGALAGLLLHGRAYLGGALAAFRPFIGTMPRSAAGRGVLDVVTALPLISLAYFTVIKFLPLIGIQPEEQQYVSLFREGGPAVVLAITLLAVCVAPVVEELVFRALLYKGLQAKFGTAPAAVVSSALFALVHANAAGMVPFFLLGLVLCRLIDRTGDVRACIAGHALFNLNTSIQLILTLVFTDGT